MQREFDLKLQALSMFKLHNLPNNDFFTVPLSLAGKKMLLGAKDVRFVNKSHC